MNLLNIFKLIDPVNCELFISEVNKQERIIEDIFSVGEMINLSFTWYKSSQGHKYWENLRIKYSEVTPRNYTKFLPKVGYYI